MVQLAAGNAWQVRAADNVPGLTDPGGRSRVTSKRAEVDEPFAVPKVRVRILIPGQVAGPDNLATVVHPTDGTKGAAQVSDVPHPAVVPHERVKGGHSSCGAWRRVGE